MRELDSPTPSALASCKHSFESHWTGLGARGDRAADLSDRCGTGLFLSVAHRSIARFGCATVTAIPQGRISWPPPSNRHGSGDARNDVDHTQPRYELVVQVSFDCRGRAPPPALLGGERRSHVHIRGDRIQFLQCRGDAPEVLVRVLGKARALLSRIDELLNSQDVASSVPR
jgi:hypothetical protein